MEIAELEKQITNYINEFGLVIRDPKRRERWDKWTYEIMKAYNYAKENKAKISKICKSKKIVNSDEELKKLAYWCNSLFVILPNDIIYDDILIEIDTNCNELRTKREKDSYLSKLVANIFQLIILLEILFETHPEFKPKDKENYDEQIHQFTLEKLKCEKNKYIIQSYYIQISKLINIFLEILAYAQGLKNKINEDIISENKVGIPIQHLIANTHKLVLLKEIGVFDFLLKNYVHDDKHNLILEDFSKLIGEMIGANGKDIRSDVGRLKNEILDPKKKKVVQTPKAKISVKNFLNSIGL